MLHGVRLVISCLDDEERVVLYIQFNIFLRSWSKERTGENRGSRTWNFHRFTALPREWSKYAR